MDDYQPESTAMHFDPGTRPSPGDGDSPSIRQAWRGDALASVVVFFVALPLCLGIALASGMPAASGLITGIIGGLVVGFLAGSPLQVSGPAAGLITIVAALVHQYGHEVLGPVVMLAGLAQIAAGLLKLGPWFRAVSPAVIKGMLSGIGVMIFAGQFHVMVDDAPKKSGLQNIITLPEAVVKGLPLPEWRTAEEREFRSEMLKQVGRLHETQEEIADAVHGHVSDHSTPEEAAAQAVRLAPLIPRQTALAAELSRLVETLYARRLDADADHSTATLHRVAYEARTSVGNSLSILSSAVADGTIAKTFDDSGRVSADVRATQTQAVASIENLLSQIRSHDWAAKVGLATIALILLWQGLAPRKLRLVPAPLVAVAVVTGITVALSLPVKAVELPASLLHGVNVMSFTIFNDVPLRVILEGVLVISVVASAETLLCASAVDQMHRGPRTNYDRELTAQGVGNALCGFLGGLPMTGVIVRSAANVQAGGRTRLSAILHGVWLLASVALFASILQHIPTACLAGLLVYTGFKLMHLGAFGELWKHSPGEAMIYLATVVTIVSTDLLVGVITGVVLSALKLLYTFSHVQMKLDVSESGDRAKLSLEGAATFMRLPALAAELARVPRGAELRVDMQHLSYIDHACLDLLTSWARQHESQGGRLVIDWETLHATFQQGVQTPTRRNGRNGTNGHHPTDGETPHRPQRVNAGV